MNNKIKKVLMAFIMFFAFGMTTNALSSSILSKGDIVIGNTVFHEDTWISAARASKAGALFTKNNIGDTNIYIYYYVNDNLIYVYNESEEKYNLLSEEEINNLNTNLNIYYENNEGLLNTYQKTDEEDDSVDILLNYVTDDENYNIELDDKNVVVDTTNETITCPYEYEFTFKVNFKNAVESESSEQFYGYCGINGFTLVNEYEKNLAPLDVVSVELASDENFINQNKLEYNGSYYKINDNLQEFMVDGQTGKYVVFDITLNENSVQPEVYENNYSNMNVKTKYIGKNKVRCFISTETYSTYSGNFVLVDGYHNTYKTVNIYIMPKDKGNYDLSVINVQPSELSVENNNQSKISELKTISKESKANDSQGNEITLQYNDYHYYVVGDLVSYQIEGLNLNAKEWIATDIKFNDGVDYDSLNVNISAGSSNNYYYEKLSDRLRIYIAPSTTSSTINYNNIYVSIHDLSTTGNNHIYFELSFSSYKSKNSVDYNYEKNEIVEFNRNEDDTVSLIKIDSNVSLYFNTYFNERTKKLYYADFDSNYFPLMKNNSGIQTLYKDENELIKLSDVFAVVLRPDFGISTISDKDLNIITSGSLENYIGEDDVKIYYFFNREKTEEETKFINDLETLSQEKTNFVISDISSTIYEN